MAFICVNYQVIAPIEIAHIFPYEDLSKIAMDEINYALLEEIFGPIPTCGFVVHLGLVLGFDKGGVAGSNFGL